MRDFEAQLRHRCSEAVRSMGRKSAAIMGDAASQGALGNSRLIIVLADALEEHWRSLVDSTVEDMREFVMATNTGRSKLIEPARQEMLTTLPTLRKVSRLEKAEDGYPARVLSGDSAHRVEAFGPYMEMRLRQFEIGLGEATKPKGIAGFLRDLSKETLVAVSSAAVLAAIAAAWALLR